MRSCTLPAACWRSRPTATGTSSTSVRSGESPLMTRFQGKFAGGFGEGRAARLPNRQHIASFSAQLGTEPADESRFASAFRTLHDDEGPHPAIHPSVMIGLAAPFLMPS